MHRARPRKHQCVALAWCCRVRGRPAKSRPVNPERELAWRQLRSEGAENRVADAPARGHRQDHAAALPWDPWPEPPLRPTRLSEHAASAASPGSGTGTTAPAKSLWAQRLGPRAGWRKDPIASDCTATITARPSSTTVPKWGANRVVAFVSSSHSRLRSSACAATCVAAPPLTLVAAFRVGPAAALLA
jgi:hypothetical protein